MKSSSAASCFVFPNQITHCFNLSAAPDNSPNFFRKDSVFHFLSFNTTYRAPEI